MSSTALEQFREMVLADPTLQQQLASVVDRDRFVLRVVQLGAIHGFRFTVEEVQQAMHANRRAWFEQRRVR